MSNIKDMLYDLVLAGWPPCCHRRWAHAPVIHATSHFYHEKRVAWVSISIHICDPFPIVMGLHLAALRAAGAPLLLILNMNNILTILINSNEG